MGNIFYSSFIKHYNLGNCYKKCEKRTSVNYFELNDISKVLHISPVPINGMAKYENRNLKTLIVFDYDRFFSSLPHLIGQGKRRCDAVLYTINDKSYFILNELKDRDNHNSKKRSRIRITSKDQLFQSLNEMLTIPEFNTFINSFTHKLCISSNAKPHSVGIIGNVINSFNPLSRIAPNGLNLPDNQINSLNFQYWDLLGDQTFKLI